MKFDKLDSEFSFAVRLGMLHYSLWEMPVRGELSPVTLISAVSSSIMILYIVLSVVL